MRPQYQQRPGASNNTAHPYPTNIDFLEDLAAKQMLLGDRLRNERDNIVKLLVHGKARKIWDDKPPKGVFFGGLKPLAWNPNFDPPGRSCFKCWDSRHETPNCQQEARFLYCFNCGRKDIELQDCPRCREAFIISYPPNVRKAIEASTAAFHDLLLHKILISEQRKQRVQNPPQAQNSDFYSNRQPINNSWPLSEPPRVPCKFEPLDEISRRIDNVLNEFPPSEKVTSLFNTQNKVQAQFDTPFFREFGERLRRENAAKIHPGLVSTNRIDEILREQPTFSIPPAHNPTPPAHDSASPVRKNVFSRLQKHIGPIRNKPNLITNPYGLRKKLNQNFKQRGLKARSTLNYVNPFSPRKKNAEEEEIETEEQNSKQNIERSPSPQVEIIEEILKEESQPKAEDNDDLPSNVKRRFGERLGTKLCEEPSDGDDQASVQSVDKCEEEDTSIMIHVDEEGRRCLNDCNNEIMVQNEEEEDCQDKDTILIHIDEEGRRSLFAS